MDTHTHTPTEAHRRTAFSQIKPNDGMKSYEYSWTAGKRNDCQNIKLSLENRVETEFCAELDLFMINV